MVDVENKRIMKIRSRVAVWIALLVLGFSVSIKAQDGEHHYTVSKGGAVVGSMRTFADGRQFLEGVYYDSKQTVLFQDKYDRGHYDSVSNLSGTTVKVNLANLNGNIPFDHSTVHHVLLLKWEFPQNPGEVRTLNLLDPVTKSPYQGTAECTGYRIKTIDEHPVKLKQIVFQAKDLELDVYQDKTGAVMQVLLPGEETTYTADDVVAASFPIDTWELGADSDCCKTESIQMSGTSGNLINGILIRPAKGVRSPAALIFGPEESASFLKSLAYHLASRNVAALVILTKDKSPRGPEDDDLLFRYLRRQTDIDPTKMFVVGFKDQVADALTLLGERKDLSGAILMSPSPGPLDQFLQKTASGEATLAQSAGIFILQGENEPLWVLQQVNQWMASINQQRAGNPVAWTLIPQVNEDFLSPRKIHSKFPESNERNVGKSVFAAVGSFLESHDLIGKGESAVPKLQVHGAEGSGGSAMPGMLPIPGY